MSAATITPAPAGRSCPACTYDLSGLPPAADQCPECGGGVTDSALARSVVRPAAWTLARRVAFRLGFLYFGLYFLPFPLTTLTGLFMFPIPARWIGQGAAMVSGWFERGQNAVVQWTGTTLLGLEPKDMPIQMTGSGDTMMGYVNAFTLLVISGVGAAIWSVIDYRRPAYLLLSGVWRVYLRYALAAVLLSYGLAKVPPLQFPPPGPESLVRTYGDSSPMGLLWTFMGASMAYTVFAGLAEIVPGVLLLFRRTALLGALIGAATMTNVVLLNFCYDVPVKLYSSHLLATALILIAHDGQRLACLLVLNRTAPRTRLWTPLKAAWKNWTLRGVKAAFIALLLGSNVYGSYQGWTQRGPGAPRGPFAGVYEIELYEINGEARPPLLTDTARWRRFMVSRWGSALIQKMDDSRDRYMFKHDPVAGTVELASRDGGTKHILQCRIVEKEKPVAEPPIAVAVDGGAATPPAPSPLLVDRLILEGPFGNDRIKVELKKADEREFLLTGRGFHWIQEFPFNR